MGACLVFGLGTIMPAAKTRELKGIVKAVGFRESKMGGQPFVMVQIENGNTVKAYAPLGFVFKKDERAIIQEGIVILGWNRYKFIRYETKPAQE